MSDKITKYQEWIRWGIVVAFAALQLWLKDNFITKERYERDMMKIESITSRLETGMNAINMTLVSISTQNKTLEDHEQRLRKLEDAKK